MSRTVEHYEGPLLRYALRLTHDLDTARDVVQDVFLRLWQAEPPPAEEHLSGWLFMVCRNRSFDILRRRDRMELFSDEQWAMAPSLDPAPDQLAAEREKAEAVSTVLATLPPNQQEVVRLKFQNGLNYREISEITRLSVSNVGFLIHKAMNTLRRRMRAASPLV